MISQQIKECFEHIDKYWPLGNYQKCAEEWEYIKKFIIEDENKDKDSCQCKNCKTWWTHKKFINDIYNICPSCDTWCQPFLCNPKNFPYVLKYIKTMYYEFLIPSEIFKECDVVYNLE